MRNKRNLNRAGERLRAGLDYSRNNPAYKRCSLISIKKSFSDLYYFYERSKYDKDDRVYIAVGGESDIKIIKRINDYIRSKNIRNKMLSVELTNQSKFHPEDDFFKPRSYLLSRIYFKDKVKDLNFVIDKVSKCFIECIEEGLVKGSISVGDILRVSIIPDHDDYED